MQPSQAAGDIGNAVASRPRYQYTQAGKLSPSDLQTLHEIVSLASVFPGKSSFRAIWRAYDVVLAARNINPAHDSTYFRFILQLQGVEGRNIYDRFMVLLAIQGIDVSEQSFLETPAATTEFTRQRYEEARQRRDRSSRGIAPTFSDDSYQAESEAPRQLRGVSSRRTGSSSSRAPRGGGNGGSNSSPTREAVVAAELAARAHREEVRVRRGRSEKAAARAAALATTTTKEDEDEGEEGEEEDDDDDDAEDIPRPRVPSDAADSLYNVRMKAVIREYFRHWHTLTVKRVVRHQYLEQMAARFDRKALLGQAFDILQEKRWFALVEERAGRRYNTILAMRVWAVWVQKTAAIVQRTHEVRQRILMRKYFNAWRTIVIENEEKIRLFQLSSAFWKWRGRARERVRMAVDAQRVYEANLSHRAYWSWFFQLCGILGTRKHNRLLREQAFDTWAGKTERIIRMNRMANAFYRRRTLQVIFNYWSERTIVCLEQEEAAEDHAEWRLTERTFVNWLRQARMAPLVVAMSEYVNDRVMGNFITLWWERTRQVQSAEATARRKLLQFGLSSWRLRLRRRIMTEQVLHKVQITAIHRWIIQSRLHRLRERRARDLCRYVLIRWSCRCHELRLKLEQIAHQVAILRNSEAAVNIFASLRHRIQFRRREEAAARAFHARLVLGKALPCWRSKTQRIQFMREMEADAIRVHQSHILSKALIRWRRKTELYREFDDWAEDAIYYFTVRRTMHKWKTAFKSHRRDRLRKAFHTQARKTKRELAEDVLGHWVARVDHIRHLNDIAQEFGQRRTESTAVHLLRLWRLQAEEITNIQPKARQFNRIRLLRTCLRFWTDYRNDIYEMNQGAAIIYEAQSARIALKYFQVWETAGWHLKILRMTGDRFERKRYKNLLKGWKNAALERIESRKWLEGRGIDNTIDEGFGVEWMEPLTAGQAPPLPRVQELGQSIFSQSVRVGQGSSLRRSVLGQSVLGQSTRGTPGVGNMLLQTPNWRAAGRSRLLSRTPAGNPMTPRNVMQTPGSPLMRFSDKRGRQGLSSMNESLYE